MQPDDLEHPDSITEAESIELAGGMPFVEAIGDLVGVMDKLFDGPGKPDYAGASRQAEDVLFEHPPHNGIRMFTRQFWGFRGTSVVGAFCQKGQRPALMSIVPVDLDISGARNLDASQAATMALAIARRRSSAL